jgi:transcriptional regulator GlxA family with amidase domain
VIEPSIKLLDDVIERRSRQIDGFAERLSSELRSPDEHSELAVSGLVYELVSSLGRSGRTLESRSAHQPSWLARAIDYLHANDDRIVRIEDVAHEVDLHPGYLARAFREHAGKPIAAYAREIRLERVAAELTMTDDRILDIAIAAGFSDQSHLTRLFRRHFGVTPAQYRSTVK